MDQFEKNIIIDFLSENWSEFEKHCASVGAKADEVEETLLNNLNK